MNAGCAIIWSFRVQILICSACIGGGNGSFASLETR